MVGEVKGIEMMGVLVAGRGAREKGESGMVFVEWFSLYEIFVFRVFFSFYIIVE